MVAEVVRWDAGRHIGMLPPECHEEGTFSMRTLIAWEPEHMAEVVRIVATSATAWWSPAYLT